MSGEFQTDLWALRKVANSYLPAIESVWTAHGQRMAPQSGYMGAYGTLSEQTFALTIQSYADDLAERLRFGAKAVEETAATLRDIADLYARADGQT